MFIDACAIVAMIAGEESAVSYFEASAKSETLCTSAMATWEAILVLSRPGQLNCNFKKCHDFVVDWLDAHNIKLVEPNAPGEILREAISVAEKYGVSRRSLSAMDCFHYAYAKQLSEPLLTLDKALRKTDITCLP
jgi:ribonuclease VapC